MNGTAQISPDADSLQLAREMVDNRSVMTEIITETITSAKAGSIKEAGRTICPGSGSVKGPLQRFPRAVDLAACPVSRGGTYHTHVTANEMRTPENSLPDMANVVYGLTDVSVVVGTQTADVIVAAGDREQAVVEFENAIGESVSGPRELHDAITGRRIEPTTARARARRALDPMTFTAETGFPDLESEIDAVRSEQWAAPMVSGKNEAYTGQSSPLGFNADSVEKAAQSADEIVPGDQIKGLVISTTIGTVIGGLIDRVVFGD